MKHLDIPSNLWQVDVVSVEELKISMQGYPDPCIEIFNSSTLTTSTCQRLDGMSRCFIIGTA
jgi:hypothetical protein